MFRVKAMLIFYFDEFPHNSEKIYLALVTKSFLVFQVWLFNNYIAVMHVINAIAGPK